jgi:hypothetical protein
LNEDFDFTDEEGNDSDFSTLLEISNMEEERSDNDHGNAVTYAVISPSLTCPLTNYYFSKLVIFEDNACEADLQVKIPPFALLALQNRSER